METFSKLVLNVFNKVAQFFREVRTELKKVSWPPRKDTFASTSVVLVIVFVIAIFLFIIDQGLSFVIRKILS
ncbi:MAG: preprotein translocase subunit SecE [Deltaproteobacteria bacterium]|nr:preprotein translocase subunit SecE [Deltaproteobacteria bacterium]